MEKRMNTISREYRYIVTSVKSYKNEWFGITVVRPNWAAEQDTSSNDQLRSLEFQTKDKHYALGHEVELNVVMRELGYA